MRATITHALLGYLLLALALVPCAMPAAAQLAPPDAIGLMGRGINLGNTLEPPFEGSWNNGPAQEYYFDDYKAAGFATVRIPVRWDEHTADTTPFTVDASWLNRVEQIVDWGLARDLFIIINGHHEDWLKQNYASATLRARYDSIWSQVATRFRDKSEKLFFEVINEPFGMTRQEVDNLNARAIGIIRRTNPTRIVIFSGNEYSNSPQLLAAAIPNDPYLMGYFHSYDPWSFAGLKQGTWGASADRSALAAKFQSVADWSAANSIPVMISEFGAIHGGDFNSRMRHYAAYVEESLMKGFAFQAWDDGGDFRIYLREERDWNESKDVLIHTYPDGPTGLATSVEGDSILTLSWTNRTVSASSITVERKSPGGGFEQIAQVSGGAVQFSDSTVSGGQRYLYRVIANSTTEPAKFSYPIEVRVAPTRRSSFHGAPFPIPGTIEAEDYDIGGEGLTYHDTDANNIPGAYRPNEGVDIEPRDEGGFQVAYIESGEWLEYTVDVAEDAEYRITAFVASLNGGGRFRYEFGTRFTRAVTVPSTNSWQTLTSMSTSITLPAGEQVMRVRIADALPFNIDRYVIEEAGAASAEAIPESDVVVDLYPNPTANRLFVTYRENTVVQKTIELYDVLGRLLVDSKLNDGVTTVELDHVPRGVYVARVLVDGRVVGHRAVVRN